MTETNAADPILITDKDSENSENTVIYLSRRSSRRSNSSSEQRKYDRKGLKRIIRKSGKVAIFRNTIPQRIYRYSSDLANTVINSRWRNTLLILSSTFVATWLIFAGLWMVVENAYEDFESNPNGRCVTGVKGFAGYMMFSIETQTSIGFGNRSITSFCPEAVFLICCQVLIGYAVCGTAVSIVFAKMIGPNRSDSQVSFSKNAVIYIRDGELCLIFRIRDATKKYASQNTLKAYLVLTQNEEMKLKNIKLEPPGMLIWPLDVVHKICETSPFWDLSAKDLIMKRFELIVTMEGVSASTNQMSTTTTSYLNKEILWGNRFRNCVSYSEDKQCYVVNSDSFNATEVIPTPLCSAERMSQVYQDALNINEVYQTASSPGSLIMASSPSTSSGTKSPESGIVMTPVFMHSVPNQRDDTGSSGFSSLENSPKNFVDQHVERKKLKVDLPTMSSDLKRPVRSPTVEDMTHHLETSF